MYNMAMKISQLKAQLRKIQENIQELEHLKNFVESDTLSESAAQKLMTETSTLLDNVQKQPKRRLLKQIAKRRAKRRRKKKTKPRIITPSVLQTENKIDSIKETSAESNEVKQRESQPPKPIDQPESQKNEFQQLRNYQQAQRYLRTFELLEILHYARSEDKQLTQQLHEKFVDLRTFWNSVLLENTPKRSERKRIEDQWNEVFFGASEKTFYGSSGRKCYREEMSDFLKLRRTWDSYLVRNEKQGTCIPLGWVLPPKEPSESWAKYKADAE